MIDSSGTVSTIVGTGETYGYGEGDVKDALLYSPIALDIDDNGDWYFVDLNNHLVRKVSF